jgi:hypothetical protein
MIQYNMEKLAEILVSMDKIKKYIEKHTINLNTPIAQQYILTYIIHTANLVQMLLEQYATPEDIRILCWGATNKLDNIGELSDDTTKE